MFHQHRELDQTLPARAKKKVEYHELTKKFEMMWSEQKIDGERFRIHTHKPAPGFLHGINSRCVSKETGRLTEKTDRVPHLSNHDQLAKDSIFDNEFVSSGDIVLIDFPGKLWDKLIEPNHPHMVWLKNKFSGALPTYPHVSNTSSILGSLAAEAIRKQEERGPIWAYCFDLTRYKGKSAWNMAQSQRRKALASVMETIDPEKHMILMPAWKDLTLDEIQEFFTLVTDVKGEGLILKDPNQIYNGPSNWWKLKKDYPADVVFTGNVKVGEEGKTGQMLGMASSLEIGVYHNGVLYPIGWVSAIMDGHQNLMPAEEAKMFYKDKVIECRHNDLQKDASSPIGVSLRHPRFRRRREDKSPEQCTLASLMAECKVSK